MCNIDIQSPEFVKCLEQGEQEAFQRLFETFHKALSFFAARIVRSFGGGGHCAGCFPFLLENGPRWVP